MPHIPAPALVTAKERKGLLQQELKVGRAQCLSLSPRSSLPSPTEVRGQRRVTSWLDSGFPAAPRP